tara:strand:+ start:233 stop:790 length:558 start_codon:yes stop_codon:yes gene_type:complete
LTQKDLIFTFLLKNPNARPVEIAKALKLKPESVRGRLFDLRKEKVLSKPVLTGKNKGKVKVRKTKEARKYEEEIKEKRIDGPPPKIPIYRKIVKIGASCGGKFRKLYALTFEYDEEPREAELITKIEIEFPNCDFINYDARDLTDHKGIFIRKKDDIEDYGYSQEEYEDSVKINEFFPNIEVGEE